MLNIFLPISFHVLSVLPDHIAGKTLVLTIVIIKQREALILSTPNGTFAIHSF